MVRTYEEFKKDVLDRNVKVTLNNIVLELESYSGAHIHRVNNIRGMIVCELENLKSFSLEPITFRQYLEKDPTFELNMKTIYDGNVRGMYKV